MSRLTRVVDSKQQAAGVSKAAKKIKEIPQYDMSGKFFSEKRRKRRTREILVIAIVAGVIAFIYLPGFFMGSSTEEASYEPGYDASAITVNSQVLRDYPEEDFDGDGLSNAEETACGTDPWWPDTDGDGATDFYEVKVSDTDPTRQNGTLLSELQNKLDKANDTSLSSPYKINNVIMWPDDYQAKANGSVVETLKGYQFCDFSGWVQFTNGAKYAYKVSGGVHEMLTYDSKQDVWYIGGDCVVETYTEPLKEVVDISVFSRHFYPNTGSLTGFLARILPDNGFITAQAKMLVDIEPDTSGAVTANIQRPSYSYDDDSRFQANTSSLSNLLYVMEAIDNNSCVAVSLYRDGSGEYIGIIYGYDADGNLYVADPDTLEPVGILQTREATRKMIGQDETLAVMSWFEFYGLGFNSLAGDRISFFAATGSYSGDGSNELIEQIQEELIDEVSSEVEEEAEEESALEAGLAEILEETGTDADGEDAAEQPDGSAADIQETSSGEAEAQPSEEIPDVSAETAQE